MREMRRVLVPGGRLLINVPGPTAPVFATMDEALERHIGPEAAGFVRVVFSLHDPDEIRTLVDSAGFQDVDVRVGAKTLHLPAPEEFLWQYVHSTPLAEVVAQTGEESRAALERDVVTEWRAYVEDGGLVYEQGLVVATARK